MDKPAPPECGWCGDDHYTFQCRGAQESLRSLNLDQIGIEDPIKNLLDRPPTTD